LDGVGEFLPELTNSEQQEMFAIAGKFRKPKAPSMINYVKFFEKFVFENRAQ
jgi:hypothetical protein